MKKKHIKKLSLNKETIHNLNNYELGHLALGGSALSLCPTPYCNTRCLTNCYSCPPTNCCQTVVATNCETCPPCVSKDTGCYPNCTSPACPT